MRSWIWALWLVAGLAALVVTVSTIALAVRQGSWSPILSMSLVPGRRGGLCHAAWPAGHGLPLLAAALRPGRLNRPGLR